MQTITSVAFLAALFAVWGVYRGARERLRAHGSHKIVWRWLSGHTHHGHAITDAGWVRPGKRALTVTGHATRFWFRPRWERAVIRTGWTLACAAAAAGLLFARGTAIGFLAALSLPAAAAGGYLAWRRWQRHAHRQEWLLPLHWALAGMLSVPVPNAPESWLEVARDREYARIELGPEFAAAPSAQQAITRVVCAKLALESPEVVWNLKGASSHVVYRATKPPQARVPVFELTQAIEAADLDTLVLGKGKTSQIVAVSLREETPHIGVSMPSGLGKTTLARFVLAQILHKGGLGIVLDTKLMSHMWARDLPNVLYADDAEKIHNVLLWLAGDGGEFDRRKRAALLGADLSGEVHTEVGPRIFILGEEMNMMLRRLRDYWTRIRHPNEPKRSPAISAFDDLLFGGRELYMNMLVVGQMLSARANSSAEARENLGTRILAGYTRNNWNIMVPEYPMPPKSRHKGRFQVASGGEVHETQIGWMTGPQAREYAISGQVARWDALEKLDETPVTGVIVKGSIENLGPDQPQAIQRPPINPSSPAISLAAALRAEILTGSLDSIRQARHRDPNFPHHVGQRGLAYLYKPEDLEVWQQTRYPSRS